MKRRTLLLVATLVLPGARVHAGEVPPDAEFLEFLGSIEGDDEAFDRYLAAHELPPRRERTTTEARPPAADTDDPHAP
ncbi:MAG: hypothetical protein U1F14_00345 [Steroidobacteraceae bacterium]